jgi:hypothetical protein
MRKRYHQTWFIWTAALALSAAFSAAPFGAGCAVENLPEPALLDVCLGSEGPCVNQAYAGERTSIVLIGEHFNPAFNVDVNDDNPPPLRGSFRASIAGTPIEDVRRHSATLLLGTLPGTVPLGSHDVIAEFPGGMRAGLHEAFSIVDPLAVTATPQHSRVPQAHAFGLDVVLHNLGTALLTQINLRLTQEGSGQFTLPADSVVASLGGESSSTTTLQLRAQQSGSATLLLEVSALAGGNVLVGTPEPLAIDMLVLPPAALVASGEVSPTTVNPGDDFELILDVYNSGGVDALEVEALEAESSGSGSATLDDPTPSPLDIPAGSRRTVRFSGQAVSSGTVVFDVRVVGREAISQRLLGPVDADPVSIEIR